MDNSIVCRDKISLSLLLLVCFIEDHSCAKLRSQKHVKGDVSINTDNVVAKHQVLIKNHHCKKLCFLIRERINASS